MDALSIFMNCALNGRLDLQKEGKTYAETCASFSVFPLKVLHFETAKQTPHQGV